MGHRKTIFDWECLEHLQIGLKRRRKKERIDNKIEGTQKGKLEFVGLNLEESRVCTSPLTKQSNHCAKRVTCPTNKGSPASDLMSG